MKNKDCKIVQDLLPNYIENLTSEDTNEFIKDHLNSCSECRTMYENMKKKIPSEPDKIDKKRVNFFKKYRNKLRFLRIVILAVILIAVAIATRKIIIINRLSEQAEKSILNTNVHKTVSSASSDSYSKTEIYSMENKIKMVSNQFKDGTVTHTEMYGTRINGSEKYSVNTYITVGDEKTARLNKNLIISANLSNPFVFDNLWQKLIFPTASSVKEATFGGEECYLISGSASILYVGAGDYYVSKETGLVIATQAYELKDSETGKITRWPGSEIKYEFGTVTENDFTEPDINEYTIKD